jgi:hypothetical protein
MAKILTLKLAMGVLGNAQAENAVGPLTTQLAETIDPDSPVDVSTDPNEAYIAGQRDALVQLRGWADKFRAGSGSQNRNIQG